MSNKDTNNSVMIHENRDWAGRLQSVIKYKTPKEDTDGFYFIPKWTIVLGSLFYVFVLIVLFAAIFVVYYAPRPGLHKESCMGRSCVKNFGLVCVNSTCSCPSGYLYIDKCILKKTNAEQCNGNNYCQDKTNLVCLNGVCSCNSSQYWNNKTCSNFIAYGKSCKIDSQWCDNRLKLICDATSDSCACSSDRYWDGNGCFLKRSIGESCAVIPCQSSLGCFNSTCSCNKTQWYNSSSCVNRFLENVNCVHSLQCLSPMICSSHKICQCSTSFNYFNPASENCIAQGTYSASCSIDYNCRVDRYLTCINGQCNCISAYPTWSNGFNKCIMPGTYTETCYATSDCSTSKSLVCSNGTSCSCPNNLSTGKCDCPIRVNSYELFWDGSSCTTALNNTQSCSVDYMCQMLTQGTSCSGSTCICPATQYFNSGTYKCETLLIVNQTCSQSDACNTGLGLSCQSGSCKCSSSQFWKSNSIGCINYYNYNNGTCSDTNQCQTSLICKNATSLSCNCPTTVSTSYCDCPAPVYGAEYYWNGSYCVVAQTYNQTCTLSYQCQMLTQLTTCTGSPLKCVCSSTSYWSFTKTKCLSCPAGWIYHRGSCFHGGPASSKISNPELASSFNANRECSELSARLAILYESDMNMNLFSSFAKNEYWIDLFKDSTSTNFFHSSKYQSNSTWSTIFWDGAYNSGEECVTYKIDRTNFKSHSCSGGGGREVMCEIVL